MLFAERYLEQISKQCRDAYIRERTEHEIRKNPKLKSRKPPYKYKPAPKWDGGLDDSGYEHSPYWPKLAKFVIEHGLDPYTVMRKRFERVRGQMPPWPNQIAQAAYLDLYKGDREIISEEDVRLKFDLDRKYAQVGMTSTRYNRPGLTKPQIWLAILLDELLEISPLMRYCIADEMNIEQAKKIFYARALRQYMLAPKAYDAAWGTTIPERLRRDKDELENLVKRA